MGKARRVFGDGLEGLFGRRLGRHPAVADRCDNVPRKEVQADQASGAGLAHVFMGGDVFDRYPAPPNHKNDRFCGLWPRRGSSVERGQPIQRFPQHRDREAPIVGGHGVEI